MPNELRAQEPVLVPIDDLKCYDNNAKKHTAEQLDAIEASIKEFGFRGFILAWHNAEGQAEIVAGHARWDAAQNLGMEQVPVVFCDDLDDAQRRALTLADNQTTMMTGWDIEALTNELDSLADVFDMGDFGFPEDSSLSGDDIDELFSDYDHTDAEKKPKMATCPECGHVFEI